MTLPENREDKIVVDCHNKDIFFDKTDTVKKARHFILHFLSSTKQSPCVELPMESGNPTGSRGPRDPSGSWIHYPNPVGTIGPASRALIFTHSIIVCFPYQLYSRQLRPHPHESKTITFWDELAHFSGKISPEKKWLANLNFLLEQH